MWYDNQTETGPLNYNLLLDADSYLLSHYGMLKDNVENASAYVSARVDGQVVVPMGVQMWIKKTLLRPITMADIDEAESIAVPHGLPFNRADWEYLVTKHGGYLPLRIYAVPEGLPVASDTVLVVVEATDSRFAWLPPYLECSLQRGIWYPTTIASADRESYLDLKWFYDHGSDNPGMLPFSLHSFGSRGVETEESAEVGGTAHAVYFQGSDDLVALRAARKYYKCHMAAYSVVATSHAIQCHYGPDGQDDYYEMLITRFCKPGAIVSVVSDGYDIYREVERLRKFKDRIVASGAKWTVRPDSGDMFEVVPRVLEMLGDIFGYTINSKGKKVLNNVGVIQGDGINRTTLGMLAQKVHDFGWAPECCIYGSGGGLLQNVNRDTLRFAQKTSAYLQNGVWVDAVKNPVTDPGKKSKKGRQLHDGLSLIYEDGCLLVDDSLDVIRARALS